MKPNINQVLNTYSPDGNRQKLVLEIINALGTASSECISALTGLDIRKVRKTIRSLFKHRQIQLTTKKKVIYWGTRE